MKIKLISAIVVMLFLTSITAIAIPVRAQPLKVWVPIQYTTIQEGVDAVAEYGTVLVLPGTYYEHVIINKPLTLAGLLPHWTIIDGSGYGKVVEASYTHNVKISGFTIRNGGLDGIYLYDCDHSQLTHLNVKSNGRHGIFTQHSQYVVIANVDTHSNSEHGIALGWMPSHNIVTGVKAYSNLHGISVYDWPTNVTIMNSKVFSNTYHGIILGWTTEGVISNCEAWSNGYTGINVDSSKNSIVKDCNAISNGISGISIWGIYPSYITITHCLAANNLANGFEVNYAWYSTVENSVAALNDGAGISVAGGSWPGPSYYNVITENLVLGNGWGIRTNEYCEANSIYHNIIVKNTNQAYDAGVNNVWDDGYPSGGNFWSDYAGVDLYGGPGQNIPGPDGIGDTPYSIPGPTGSKDRYPLMYWKLIP